MVNGSNDIRVNGAQVPYVVKKDRVSGNLTYYDPTQQSVKTVSTGSDIGLNQNLYMVQTGNGDPVPFVVEITGSNEADFKMTWYDGMGQRYNREFVPVIPSSNAYTPYYVYALRSSDEFQLVAAIQESDGVSMLPLTTFTVKTSEEE